MQASGAPPPASSAPTPAPTGGFCPYCSKVVGPNDKFCPSCGQTLQVTPATPGTSSATGSPDIRERVEGDRGALKRLQLLIPGYRLYRLGEDIRAADSMLRMQVADRLVYAMQKVDTLRSDMTRQGVYVSLADIGGLRSEMQRLEGQVRHAEGGYTGISPQVRITVEKLDRLYERDWSFISAAETVKNGVAPIEQALAAKDTNQVTALVNQLRQAIRDLSNNFATRVADVEKILQ